MLRFVFLFLLVSTSIYCIPLDSSSSKPEFDRPSPINPEVVSDPKPKETIDSKESWHKSVQISEKSNIQSTSSPISIESKEKRQTHHTENPALRHDQQNGNPKRVSTTTVEPVSLKTPIVHPSGAKTKRSADETSTTTVTGRPTSTRPPIISSSNDDYDNSGPHFVRPVPVAEILKNLHEAPKHDHVPIVSLHQDESTAESTTSTSTNTSVSPSYNDHKVYHKAISKTQEPKDDTDDSSSKV